MSGSVSSRGAGRRGSKESERGSGVIIISSSSSSSSITVISVYLIRLIVGFTRISPEVPQNIEVEHLKKGDTPNLPTNIVPTNMRNPY